MSGQRDTSAGSQETMENTPGPCKLPAHTAYPVDPMDVVDAQTRLIRETEGHYIGPMPPHLFFDEFMPWNEATPTNFRNMRPTEDRVATLQSIADLTDSGRHAKMIGALFGWPQDCVSGNKKFIECPLVLKDSHNHRDVTCSLGVDLTGYHATKPRVPRRSEQAMDFANAEIWWKDSISESADAFVDGEGAYDGNDHLAFFNSEALNAEKEIEDGNNVQADTNEQEDDILDVAEDGGAPREVFMADNDLSIPDIAPTADENFPFENSTSAGSMFRGQLASYAGASMTCQYRSHIFSICTFGRYARFMRWDQSSAVVSSRFDFVDFPVILFDFFKRLSQLTEEQRGIDPNVKPATLAEAQRTRVALKPFAPVYWTGRASSMPEVYKKDVDIATQPFLRMRFDGVWYITPTPHCDLSRLTPFGRSSRARIVYPAASDGTNPRDEVRYTKDYWRQDSPLTYPEAQIYRMLNEQGVEHVAELAAGGDSELKKTIGHTMASRDWATPTLHIRELIHHVVILKTVGRSLVTFRTAREFVSCLADAMQAHAQALERCSILHRDISVGNIMMTLDRENRRGLLIDWDHCVVLTLVEAQPSLTKVPRTGTWPFISAHLASDPDAEHTEVDDRESSIYVLLWAAHRYLQHDLSPSYLMSYLWTFENFVDGVGPKIAASKQGLLLVDAKFKYAAINQLIRELSYTFTARYEGPPKPAQWREERARLLGESLAFLRADLVEEWEERRVDVERADWVYTTMRRYAEKLPALEDENETDWKDNGAALRSTNLVGSKRVRPTSIEHLGIERHFDGEGATTPNSSSPPRPKRRRM